MSDFGSTTNSWLVTMLTGVLDQVCLGIALARKSGHLMYLNESARHYVADYALCDRSVVDHPDRPPRLGGELANRIKGAGTAREIWGSENGHLFVEIIPFSPASGEGGMLGRRGGAMLIMQERGKHNFPALGHLMDLFGLTPAEARACLTLCQADSIEACARRLNVSPATVRSQLQVAMHKTATSKQAELLSLILSVPASRRESGTGSAR